MALVAAKGLGNIPLCAICSSLLINEICLLLFDALCEGHRWLRCLLDVDDGPRRNDAPVSGRRASETGTELTLMLPLRIVWIQAGHAGPC